ncbi:hypothetical protein CRUP_011518, partial [Coryphaenoides rupestris]
MRLAMRGSASVKRPQQRTLHLHSPPPLHLLPKTQHLLHQPPLLLLETQHLPHRPLSSTRRPSTSSASLPSSTQRSNTSPTRLPSSTHLHDPSRRSSAILAWGSISTSTPGGAGTSRAFLPSTHTRRRGRAASALLSSSSFSRAHRRLLPCWRASASLTLPSTSCTHRAHSSPSNAPPKTLTPPKRQSLVLPQCRLPLRKRSSPSPRGIMNRSRAQRPVRPRSPGPKKGWLHPKTARGGVGVHRLPHRRSSSPVRPSTPSSVSPTPPPPPPRPPSRPKLPPGKPTAAGDVNRPFSPPVHSASPPPIAPLARAESTSSISSTNSLSAATTPTVGKELSVSVSENDQPSLVWFDRGKFYLTFEGCSRGPSPLTMGAQDTLPVAAAFTETVNAFFKGADTNKCVVKIIGEMVLSFPAGITRHFANNLSPAVLTFSITNYSRLEHVLPNPQLLCCDTTTQAKGDAKDFWVNMPNLISHLKKVSEQKPQATYYNVDMLKYQ